MASDDITPLERAAMELAKAVYQSILESVIPQPIMEEVGKAIVAETPWPKLSGRGKIALFRVAIILQEKLPKTEVTTAEPTAKSGLVTQALAEEK